MYASTRLVGSSPHNESKKFVLFTKKEPSFIAHWQANSSIILCNIFNSGRVKNVRFTSVANHRKAIGIEWYAS